MILTRKNPPSMPKLSLLEKALLISADDSGQIPYPEGNYSEVCMYLAALAHLDEKRYVRRWLRNGYRAYYLTKSGKALKFRIIGSEMKSRYALSRLDGYLDN